MRALALVCAVAACGRPHASEPGSADDLAEYLRTVAGTDEAARTREVTGWILDEAAWRRTVVDPYRDAWDDYRRAFDTQVPVLVARLATRGEVTARRHFAGDARLSRAQTRLRWAVPTLYPSLVAELGGAPIDTVFVYDRGAWRVLAGLDEVVVARARALDAGCGDLLARAGAADPCSQLGWMIADAALRSDRPRFDHACQLARNACGNPGP